MHSVRFHSDPCVYLVWYVMSLPVHVPCLVIIVIHICYLRTSIPHHMLPGWFVSWFCVASFCYLFTFLYILLKVHEVLSVDPVSYSGLRFHCEQAKSKHSDPQTVSSSSPDTNTATSLIHPEADSLLRPLNPSWRLLNIYSSRVGL